MVVRGSKASLKPHELLANGYLELQTCSIRVSFYPFSKALSCYNAQFNVPKSQT